jgi:hypothetical protein
LTGFGRRFCNYGFVFTLTDTGDWAFRRCLLTENVLNKQEVRRLTTEAQISVWKHNKYEQSEYHGSPKCS